MEKNMKNIITTRFALLAVTVLITSSVDLIARGGKKEDESSPPARGRVVTEKKKTKKGGGEFSFGVKVLGNGVKFKNKSDINEFEIDNTYSNDSSGNESPRSPRASHNQNIVNINNDNNTYTGNTRTIVRLLGSNGAATPVKEGNKRIDGVFMFAAEDSEEHQMQQALMQDLERNQRNTGFSEYETAKAKKESLNSQLHEEERRTFEEAKTRSLVRDEDADLQEALELSRTLELSKKIK